MLKNAKSEIIRIRVSAKVKARIIKEAEKKRVTMSELIRNKILD